MSAPSVERLEAVRERVEAMPCTRALFDVDHDEFYDGPCAHCDLITLIEGGRDD